MNPEAIFGRLDDAMDDMERRNPKPLRPAKPRSIPPISISTSRDQAIPGVEYANVVNVPKSMLRLMTSTIDKDTAKLNKLFIRNLLPLLLSYQTSTNYARAALKEGLNIEIDFDAGLKDAVDYVGYLNVVMHFIKGSNLPVSVKKRFVNKFSDKLAEAAVTKLVETNKSQTHQSQMRELQAVVYERKAQKMTVHTQGEPEAAPNAAVKKKRRQ